MAKTVNTKATVNPVEPTPTPLTIENIIALMDVPNDELIKKSPDVLQRVVNETPGMVPAFMAHPAFDLTTTEGLTSSITSSGA